MARGWESKSIEAQIEESDHEQSNQLSHPLSAEEMETKRTRANLTLSRKRILKQLEQSTNERYAELLRRTLAGLDAQISALPPSRN